MVKLLEVGDLERRVEVELEIETGVSHERSVPASYERSDLFRQVVVRNYFNIQDSRVDSLRVVGWSKQFFVKLQLYFSLVRNTLNVEGQSGTHFQLLFYLRNIKQRRVLKKFNDFHQESQGSLERSSARS